MAYVLDVKRTVWLKKHDVYPHFARIAAIIPAGSTIEGTVVLPRNKCWLVTYEVRGEIVYNVFTECCRKDDWDIFPPNTKIGRSQVHFPITYPVPYLVENTIIFSATNVDTTDHYWELVVYYGVLDKTFIDDLKKEVAFEEQIRKIMMDIWNKMSEDERRDWLKAKPFWPR